MSQSLIANGESGLLCRGAINDNFTELYARREFTPPYFDVVADYNGSGSSVQTTGTISSGSHSLVVASATGYSIGMGIYVAGAGAAGAALVTTITNIVGTTFTLTAAAATTATGQLVQHDDTAAINAARAAAYAAGGGNVFLTKTGTADGSGHYRISGAFNGTTNCIITTPFVAAYADPITIMMVGEVYGREISDGVYDGCVLDFTDCPAGAGTHPALIGDAPYVLSSNANLATAWSPTNQFIDNLLIVAPVDPTMHGIRWSNTLKATLGDFVTILAKSYVTTTPTHSTIGLWMPQALNNVRCQVGAGTIGPGFATCLRAGEHCILYRPFLALGLVGLDLPLSPHVISGEVCIESCATMIFCSGGAGFSLPKVRLTLQGEYNDTGSAWYKTVQGISDASNQIFGQIDYAVFQASTSIYMSELPFTGAQNLVRRNLINPGYNLALGCGIATTGTGKNLFLMRGTQFDSAGVARATDTQGSVLAAGYVGGFIAYHDTGLAVNDPIATQVMLASNVGFFFLSLAANPSAPTEGQTYYNTTLHKLQTYNGTTWI